MIFQKIIGREPGSAVQFPIGIYLFAFLIPFNPKWYGMAILFFAVEQIFCAIKYKQRFSFRDLIDPGKPYFYLVLFWILHLSGLLYSDNMAFGWSDIGMKASFILFPVLFLLYPYRVPLSSFGKIFIYGALITITIDLIVAFYNYHYHGGYISYFFDSRLSYFMHRSYWATYLIIAYIFSTYEVFSGKKHRVLYGFFSFLFFGAVLMTGSKMGFIILILVTLALIIRLMLVKRKVVLGSIILLTVTLITILTLLFSPSLSSRVKASLRTLVHHENLDVKSVESNTARLLMWETATELIKENPILGVGTGDLKDQLQQRNYEKGYIGVAELNLNAHNQFLNTYLAIGLPGFLVLLLLFIISYIRASGSLSFIKRLICISLFLSLLTESFLETQAGIIPVAFLLSLLPNLISSPPIEGGKLS